MHETNRTYTFTDAGPLTLRLDQRSTGDVAVRFDADEGTAAVALTADRPTDFAEITAGCHDGEVGVRIPSRPNDDPRRRPWAGLSGAGRWRVDVEVRLPAGSAVVVRATTGDVRLDGSGGPVSLALGSGDVRVESCSGGSVTTGSGDVLVEHNEADLAVTLGSGDLRAVHQGGVLHAKSGSGDLSIDQRAGSLEARTGTGDIAVTVPRGVPTWLELTTATGDVVQDVEPVGAPEEGEAHLSVRASTGTGDIVVRH